MKVDFFAGTGHLLKLFLRRDRFVLPMWVLLCVFVVYGQISFTYAMPDWRLFLGELSESPVTAAMLGPITPLSIEGAIMWRGLLQASITAMLGAALTVIRHTRTEEMTGRFELLFAGPMGQYANLSAALILSCSGSFLGGLLVSALMISNGFAAVGSLLAGLTVAAAGCFFAGLGALFAQIFVNSFGARGAIFGAYALTMVAMVSNNSRGASTGWAWLAPEAWFRITRPFGENRIWPLLVFAVLALVPMLLACFLSVRRDAGEGLMVQKEGPADSRESLSTPMALARRQQRGGVLAWAIGMAWLGGIMGMGTPNISQAIGSSFSHLNTTWADAMMKLGNREGFVAILIYVLGLMGGLSVYAITSVQRLWREEKAGHAELILSKPVGRIEWMGSCLSVAFAGSALILLVLGLSCGLGWSMAAGDFVYLPRVLAMSLSKIPPVWTIMGISALLYGWVPRIAVLLNWVILGVFIFLEMLWEVGIVGWSTMQWTPFAYAHYSIPIDALAIAPLMVLTLAAAALTGLGLLGFKRRSLD